jgi:integrase
MTQEIIPVSTQSIGELANFHANRVAFEDYQKRLAKNTKRRHRAELALFAQYLTLAGLPTLVDDLLDYPPAWAGITHGLASGFVRWMLQAGYAIGSVNLHLSTVKVYCGLAASAEILSHQEHALIALIRGYGYSQGEHVDEEREVTRIGHKKANVVVISRSQAEQLKQQPDTPQGRRDALLVCLLADHGLRCSEIERIKTSAISDGIMTFDRKKVGKKGQRHKLTRDTLLAHQRYMSVARPGEYLLMGSRKGGQLLGRMSARAITARMEVLCERIGIEGASAHDGRHAWATFAVAGGTNVKALQDAGGWKSPAMPMRYINSQEIANEGVKLG